MPSLCSIFRPFSFPARAWPRIVLLLAAVGAVFWITTYKVMDRDFWWHITAGKVLLSSGWIAVDPFAHTREGLPYLATHEWLAQIFLYLIHRAFGSTGIILFRGVVASASVGLLLSLSPRRLFLTVPLAVWGVVIAKGSFLERPQLFTFVMVAAFLVLAFRWLDAQSFAKRVRICGIFLVLELLWVNMHGGAALVGGAVVTFVLAQQTFPWWRWRRRGDARDIVLLCSTLVAMAAIVVSPPNGWGTIQYLRDLLHDQTIVYIAEWQPRELAVWFAELWPFWIAAVLSLVLGRRHVIFTVLALCMTAYLSRQAYRHEILFIFAALAACCYQCEHSDIVGRMGEWIARRRIAAAAIACILVFLLGRAAYARSFAFEQPENLFGFGQFDLARGAYDFIEREGIAGTMFNTYGIGGYLIHRGYPDRKVFIDGRNVDYGMPIMTRTYAAGVNPAQWKKLTDDYDVTYALVDYDAIKELHRLPYSMHLDRNAAWPLVYLDDWVAVYMKDIPENESVIDRFRYAVLTPTDLQYKSDFAHVPEDKHGDLVRELERVRQDNREGVKATLALANMALREDRFDDARSLAEEAVRVRPFAPEPYAVLGAVAVAEERWDDAADAYAVLLRYAGTSYPDLNRAFIDGVFEKAGRSTRRWFFPSRTPAAPSSAAGTGAALPPENALPNPAADAQQFNDEGIAQAEQGEWEEAERSFRTSIMLHPGFAEAWNNLCALLVARERTKDAVDACARAIKIAPDLADAHFNLALAYYHDGQGAASERSAREAKRLGRVEESDALLSLLGKGNTP